MIVYLAGPISGKDYDDVTGNLKYKTDELKKVGYIVFSPMINQEHLRFEKEFVPREYFHPVSTNHAIVERDRWMVKSSNIILVDLMEAKSVSIGSMMELAWAHDNNVHSVVCMPENGIHNHAFVIECADILFHSLDEGLAYLVNLKNRI